MLLLNRSINQHNSRAQGWEWLIDLTQRIIIGRQTDLKVGDLLLKLINVVAQVYEPLLQLISPRVPEAVFETALYRHPHSIPAANKLLATGQFSHCENCTLSSCPVNELYCRMFCCVYYFVMQFKGLTNKKFGVGSVSKSSYFRLHFLFEFHNFSK